MSNNLFQHGGPGSGNFGHRGRPGQVGGSRKGSRMPMSFDGGNFLPVNSTIRESLMQIDEMTNGKSLESFILRNGKEYNPKSLPKGVKMGRAQECYANAARLAWSNPGKYTYVEGFVFLDIAPLAISHAWVVDNEGNVIDNTFKTPGKQYFGVPVNYSDLNETLVENEVFGVFATPYLPGSQRLMKKLTRQNELAIIVYSRRKGIW